MKKVLFIAPVFVSMNSFSQNLIFLNNTGLGNQAVQTQNIQVFASNIFVNDNTTNKPARANANPQAYIQRASSPSGNQRRQVRRKVTNVTNTNSSNNIQTNIINIVNNNMNDDIQLQGNFSQQVNDNLGNAFGNENMIEQIASANIPAIQIGTGSLNFDLDINMPKIKFPTIKFSSRKTVSDSKHKTFYVRNKLAKLNRRMSGKLSFGKKLKIKVDNCFKW